MLLLLFALVSLMWPVQVMLILSYGIQEQKNTASTETSQYPVYSQTFICKVFPSHTEVQDREMEKIILTE